MSESVNRWTKNDATPGQDPREIDAELQDPEQVAAKQRLRAMEHPEEATGDDMGTSATRRDPYPRGDRPGDGSGR
jgi:hypothetical protein